MRYILKIYYLQCVLHLYSGGGKEKQYPYLSVGFNKHCFFNFDSMFGNFSFVTKSRNKKMFEHPDREPFSICNIV